MSKVPSLSYRKIIKALERDNWTVVRQHSRVPWANKIRQGRSSKR